MNDDPDECSELHYMNEQDRDDRRLIGWLLVLAAFGALALAYTVDTPATLPAPAQEG